MKLVAALLIELRRCRHPVDTGTLARRCAAGRPYAVQQVNTELRQMHRAGVVRRVRPARPVGGGRPPWRWELSSLM